LAQILIGLHDAD